MKTESEELEKKYLKRLAERIITLRKEKKLSQETLAHESNIARSLMRSYERQERNISFANLTRIIKLGLNMSFEDFFKDGFDDKKKKK